MFDLIIYRSQKIAIIKQRVNRFIRIDATTIPSSAAVESLVSSFHFQVLLVTAAAGVLIRVVWIVGARTAPGVAAVATVASHVDECAEEVG